MMKKGLLIFLMILLLSCTWMQSVAYADLAPDPEPKKFDLFNNNDNDEADEEETTPILLYAAGVGVVLVASVIILRRMGKKKTK